MLGLGLTLPPVPQEGTLVCSSVLAGRLPGAVASFTTSFQGDAYKVGVLALGWGPQGAEGLGPASSPCSPRG